MEPGRKRSKEMEPEPRRKRSKDEPVGFSELETNLNKMASKPGTKKSKEMESKPRRRWSKLLPPDLSELMYKLSEAGTSFIKEFNIRESRMTEIVRELRRICEEVESMQRKTDEVRAAGAAGALGGGLGLGLGILAAPFTGGLSLAVAAGAVAAGGAAAAGAVVVGSNVYKMWSEKGNAKKVEDLGKEFQQIVEPLKEILEEIKKTCEKFEEEAVKYQSGKTLENMKEFEEILRRVSRLKTLSSGAVYASTSTIEFIEDLLILIVNLFRVTPTPEKDRELRDAIIQSAVQSLKIINECRKTKTLLEEILNL